MTRAGPKHYCWAYMVQCKYGTFYAGWTKDVNKRMALHNEGRGAKYLRGRGPVKLVYKQAFKTMEEAMAQENLLKKLTRETKGELVSLRGAQRRSNLLKDCFAKSKKRRSQ